MNQSDLKRLFTHHPPKTEDDIKKYVMIREAGLMLATTIMKFTPACADQTAAIRKVREAVFTANAAIALDVVPNIDYEVGAAVVIKSITKSLYPDTIGIPANIFAGDTGQVIADDGPLLVAPCFRIIEIGISKYSIHLDDLQHFDEKTDQ